jgi:hypothetical protein
MRVAVGLLAVAASVVAGGASCGRSGLLEAELPDSGGVVDLASPTGDLALALVDFSMADLARADLARADLARIDLTPPRDLTPPPPVDLAGLDLAGLDLARPPVDLAPPPVDLAPPADLALPCPGPCDDGNPCTVDSCDGATGRCRFVPAPDGTACDDGDFCTTPDRCVTGRCVAGPPRDCSDGNSCTIDFCSRFQRACIHLPRPPGALCDDGDRCTLNDRCQPGAVCRGTARNCNDNNSCTTDRCDPATGACVNTPGPDGALCDDANPCTGSDRCTMGRCVGTPVADGLQCIVPAGPGCCTAGLCAPGC